MFGHGDSRGTHDLLRDLWKVRTSHHARHLSLQLPPPLPPQRGKRHRLSLRVAEGAPVFDGGETINQVARIATYIVAVAGVLGLGWWTSKRQERETADTPST